MNKVLCMMISGLICGLSQADQFTDDFNRADTVASTNPADIGSGYATTYPPTTNSAPQFKITSGALVISGGAAKNISFYQTSVPTANTAGDSFTISSDITTINGVVGTLLYGLCFNVQTDGSCYVLRMNTGTNLAATLQFLKFTAAGTATSVKSIAGPAVLAPSSVYHLEVSSSEPGVFSYTMTGANLGSGMSGTVSADVSGVLSNGYGGVFNSGANSSVTFDNLSIRNTKNKIRLMIISSAAILLACRRRR